MSFISNLFKPPKPPELKPLPPPAPVVRADDPLIAAAAKKQQQSDLRRKGRRSTIITGNLAPLGVSQVNQPRAGAGVLGG